MAFTPPSTIAYQSLYDPRSTPSVTVGPLSGSIGGGSPFSVRIAMRVSAVKGGAMVPVLTLVQDGTETTLLKASEYDQGPFLSIQAGTTWLACDLKLNDWIDVVVTWDGQNVSLYLDGAPGVALAGTIPVFTNPSFRVRPACGGSVRSLGVWKRCLDPDEIMRLPWQEPSSSTADLLADWTELPPRFVGPAPDVQGRTLEEVGALASWGMDVATPGSGTVADPKAAGPFSILAWVNPGEPDALAARRGPAGAESDGCILANRDVHDPGHVSLSLANGVLVARIGSTVIRATTPIEADEWAHVAVTYDGTTCVLYVNGAPVTTASAATASTLAPPALTLLGWRESGSVGNLFAGYLHSLSVWSAALRGDDIAVQMFEDPAWSEACVANFVCFRDPPYDSVAGADATIWCEDELELGNAMAFRTFSFLPATSFRARSRRPLGARSRVRSAPARLFLPVAGRGPGLVPLLGPQHEAFLQAELRRALHAIRDPRLRRALREDHARVLRELMETARRDPSSLPAPRFTLERQGDEHVLTLHGEGAPYVVRRPVGVTPKCALWWVGFIWTLISGVLAMLGIPTVQERVVAYVEQRVLTNADVVEILSTIEGKVFGAAQILSLLQIFHEFGYLEDLVWLAIPAASAWLVGRIAVYLLGLAVPIPTPQRVMFIKNAASLAVSLAFALGNYSSCCGSTVLIPGPGGGLAGAAGRVTPT